MPESVTKDELLLLIEEEDAQVVEVLPSEEYEREHIEGAINIPLKELDREAAARLDPGRPVIVYCWDYQ